MSRRSDVERWVDETAEQHHLTGLSVGVLVGDERIETSRGWANKDAGIEARPDQIHQIGSVTKTYVTTMVNRLFVDGTLSLDDALPDVLPELRLHGDPDLSAIKVRHLLTHTSGLPGDAFLETGEGDESLVRWIEALGTEATGLEAAAGTRWSYCNTAFGLLGRVVEHKTGLPFRRAMRELVTRPLGILTPVVTSTEALRFRVAIGHALRPDEGGEVRTARWAMLPVSSAPAGSTPSARVGDVLTYARAHVDPTDERLGPRASLDALQEHHADQPAYMGRGQGLGWMRQSPDPLVIGHGGSTQTQHTMLLASRNPALVTVVCCNDLHGSLAVRDLSRRLWGELGDLDLLGDPEPVELADGTDLGPLVGAYERFGNRTTVGADGGRGLSVRVETTTAGETATVDLERVAPTSADGTTWRGFQPLQDAPTTMEFLEWHDGRPAVLHSGGRANLRA